MANLKDIRDRIKSVKSIQKVTKAMKMVAAAKMRRAQENMEQARPYTHRLTEVIQHLLGDVEISDHPIPHRPDSHDVSRRTSDHLLRFASYGLDATSHLVDGDDRRFVDDNPFATGVHAGIGRAKIDGQITGKQRKYGADTQRLESSLITEPTAAAASLTPFLPLFLIQYIASSAVASNRSTNLTLSGNVAIPVDTVSRTWQP